MNVYLLSALTVVASYLIGAIPFGYLIFYALRGIDIRTVGSGNIGATNVGRNLGFRYFVLVFALDVAKGWLPTHYFPHFVPKLPDVRVLVALATILGHNFPIYLKFKGGKGVATSLGAIFALDPIASGATLLGGLTVLVVTRYVSLASLTGGLFFLFVHFSRTESPWSHEERAMSVLSFGLVAMLFVRHRQNLVRLGAGTEPKFRFRKPKPTESEPTTPGGEANEPPDGTSDEGPRPPSGKISWALLIVLAIVSFGVVAGLSLHASKQAVAFAGPVVLSEVARVGTGYQRAERVAFADHGRVLAVTCPRYNRLVLYRVSEAETLEPFQDIELTGRPVAVAASADRIRVLEAPSGDARHLEPGWWDTFDHQGQKVGDRCIAGYYPDDLVLTSDGRHALVLTSGRAEGGEHRPAPALEIFALDDGPEPRIIGRLTFDEPRDDPDRITLSASAQCATVTLLGTDQAAAVDLLDLSAPKLIGRTDLVKAEVPYPSTTVDDAVMMPVFSRSEAVWATWSAKGGVPPERLVACTLPHGSGLRLYHVGTGRSLGELTLRGPLNLGRIRPTGLAFAPERNLLALANRSGGVHLIEMRLRDDLVVPSTGLADARGDDTSH